MQLSRIRFFGLVLSACWMLGVTFYQRQIEALKAQHYALTAYYICAERQADAGVKDLQPCLDRVGKDWDRWMNRKWGRIAYIALVPIAAAWTIGLIGFGIYRWKKGD